MFLSDSVEVSMHMGLETENVFILSFNTLLGTCCVPSRVPISGIQMEKARFFPREWREGQTCEQPVCLVNEVCVRGCVRALQLHQLAGLAAARYLVVGPAGSVSVLSFRHRSVGVSQRT